MKWEHKCSLDWLKKRQLYLTASEVKSLLPMTNTGRKRNVGNVDYLKVLAGKLRDLTDEDCMSYGATARGHILEPYAIDVLNSEFKLAGIPNRIFWWDDELIPKHLTTGGLAFSPDGLDILPVDFWENSVSPTSMAEVKCYSDKHHLETAFMPKEKLEERWQIATGMAVCDSIESAYLVLFDPDLERWSRCFAIRYEREELKDEIETILDIEQQWLDFLHDYDKGTILDPKRIMSNALKSTQDIEKEVEAFRRLNPVL